EHGGVVVAATGSDPEGLALTYAWDLDGDGSFETSSASPTFSAALFEAPKVAKLTVRVMDPAGLSATDTADVDVTWAFGGFQAPVTPCKDKLVKHGSGVTGRV